MIHLNTDQHPARGWRVRWLDERNTSATQSPMFERDFSRIVIGVSLDEGPHAVVLAERRLLYARTSAYFYMVLDEAKEHLAQLLFPQIIALKDRYLVNLVCSAARPTTLVSALTRLEGLTNYQTEHDHTAMANWPSFHSFDTLALVRTQELPEEVSMHQALEEHLKADVIDPMLGDPILAGDGKPVKRVQVPGDFNTNHTAAAIRQAATGPCAALYLAIEAMWPTRDLEGRKHRGPEKKEKRGNTITGY